MKCNVDCCKGVDSKCLYFDCKNLIVDKSEIGLLKKYEKQQENARNNMEYDELETIINNFKKRIL